MPSLFSLPTLAPAASLPQRPVQEVERTPPAQAQQFASGQAYGNAPHGAGAPTSTGATTEPTAVSPQPTVTPPVSTSQAGRMAATVIAMQDRTDRSETKDAEARAEATQSETPRESAAPREAEQGSGPADESGGDSREQGQPPATAADQAEADPARAAAESYRNANETTAGAEPGRLLMSA